MLKSDIIKISASADDLFETIEITTEYSSEILKFDDAINAINEYLAQADGDLKLISECHTAKSNYAYCSGPGTGCNEGIKRTEAQMIENFKNSH